MRRQSLRVRIGDRGEFEVIDPGFDTLDVLRSIDPSFEIRTTPLPGFDAPRFLNARIVGTELAKDTLRSADESDLAFAHKTALQRIADGTSSRARDGEATLLDLKIELARRMLSHCQLCAHRCGVDRNKGELGVCRLGPEAIVAEHFVHIAEEPFINPSLVLNLAGCGLRCRYCQQGALLNPARVVGDALAPELWPTLDASGARSLSFIGGNPDESLFAILRFLNAAPGDWVLPIAWNCHAYATRSTVDLLYGVVDAYIPDLKYAAASCAEQLSKAPDYPVVSQAAIDAMLGQNVPVIVRILVLPGHFECCHAPALRFLSSIKRDNLFVSIRGQYCPDWMITRDEPLLGRRPVAKEINDVTELASEYRLLERPA